MLRILILGVACALSGIASAEARPTRTASAEPVAQEAASGVRPIAMMTPDTNQVCGRSRRRLWLEGEGWVVRKVSTCR